MRTAAGEKNLSVWHCVTVAVLTHEGRHTTSLVIIRFAHREVANSRFRRNYSGLVISLLLRTYYPMARIYSTGKRKTITAKQRIYTRTRPNQRARISTAVFANNPPRRQEIKALDYTFNAAAITSTGGIALLNGMQIGDQTNEREGKAIQAMFLKLSIDVFNADVCVGEAFRLFLVWDKQPNGTLATWQDIFVNQTVHTQQRQDTKQRYTVLKTWKGAVTNNNTAGLAVAVTPYITFDSVISLKKTCIYTGSGSTIGSLQQGALYMCAISRSAKCNLAFSSQFGFIDI